MIDLPRLYPILDVDLAAARGLPARTLLDVWLDAGVRLVQLRAKTLTAGPLLELADALVHACRQAGASLIVNDRADVARLSGAAGVHVGQDDLPPGDVRAMVGRRAIVGLSTHTDEQMQRALSEPISYLAVGPVFATSSKANPDPVVGLEGLRRASELAGTTDRPVVAIGGITVATARDVIAAGAASVAVISDLLTDDPRTRICQYLNALR